MQRLPGGGKRRRIGVGYPLEVVQAVKTEVSLRVQSPIRHDPRDHVKVECLACQVEFEEALGLGARLRLGVIGPPDRVEAGTSPTSCQRGEGTELQSRRDRALLETGRNERLRGSARNVSERGHRRTS